MQPSALLYRDLSVRRTCTWSTRSFQGVSWRSNYEHRNVWLRLVGPGRVAVQSVFGHQSGERITGSSSATRQSW